MFHRHVSLTAGQYSIARLLQEIMMNGNSVEIMTNLIFSLEWLYLLWKILLTVLGI